MNDSGERWELRVLSGEDRSIGATLLRGALSIAEPFYAAAMAARNALYDAGVFASHRLPRPTLSVGNLTTGGTGKTPIVQLLAEKLIERNLRPAILLRGYRSEQTGGSDEQQMLQALLGPRAIVVANPDRVAGAAEALRQTPQPDVFILDDGFQHRRARRDFDLVLIDAANPFGYGHVLPRGLLREARRGLARADAILVTRVTDLSTFEAVQQQIRRHNERAPVVVAEHVHVGLTSDAGDEVSIDVLAQRRFYAFAGIGNADSLRGQLMKWGATFTGFRAFPDHHAYSTQDLLELDAAARSADAEMLVTTEKDWIKIARLQRDREALPVNRLKLAIQLPTDAADRLTELVLSRLRLSGPASPSAEVGRAS